MKHQPKNIAASIHAKLTNEAKKLNRPFAEVLQYYGMERFLYRLSKTPYVDSFILKGGLVFYSWDIPLRRPTKDIDFLGLLENRREIINKVITAALSISVPEDGVIFDPATLSIEKTEVDDDRTDMRVKFLGYLSRTQIPIHIDFGFSDEITSEAQIISYPTLLHNMGNPQLMSYPVESVVAEKFHAMERFAQLPSRWKDYYDVWLISEHFDFDNQLLQKAISKTFENRATPIPIGRPISLTMEFAVKYRENWRAFVQKFNLENPDINDLAHIAKGLMA
jgi:predicted nucleotidyltransferase component of viral defense system